MAEPITTSGAVMTKPQSMGVDPDCVDLARRWLLDAEVTDPQSNATVAADLTSLSEAIQKAIEDWFFAKERGID